MSKEKLAIVSSYDDFCGNASYTKALVDKLTLHYEVVVIALDIEVLRKGNADCVHKYIKKICDQLAQFDCVNIQFEAGLFGSNRYRMKQNFLAIAKSSKKLVLTMHRIHGHQAFPSLMYLCKMICEAKFAFLFKTYKETLNNNCWANFYNKIVKFCIGKKVPIIVHTRRDRDFIKRKYNYELVFDHPLSFCEQDKIQNIAKSYTRNDFCKDLCLNENHTYIGIFGFINKMKGHTTIIKALQHLPQNHELLIFGSQHPHSIKVEEEIDAYIDTLLTIIKNMKLSNRVKFYRISNDDEFLKALLCCDFNVLPYWEVNQGGSGIAALTLETNSNAIFSQNFAFFELAKYAPNAFKMFSIGNHLELANAISSYRKSDFEPHLREYHKQYNPSSNALLYKRLLSRTI